MFTLTSSLGGLLPLCCLTLFFLLTVRVCRGMEGEFSFSSFIWNFVTLGLKWLVSRCIASFRFLPFSFFLGDLDLDLDLDFDLDLDLEAVRLFGNLLLMYFLIMSLIGFLARCESWVELFCFFLGEREVFLTSSSNSFWWIFCLLAFRLICERDWLLALCLGGLG